MSTNYLATESPPAKYSVLVLVHVLGLLLPTWPLPMANCHSCRSHFDAGTTSSRNGWSIVCKSGEYLGLPSSEDNASNSYGGENRLSRLVAVDAKLRSAGCCLYFDIRGRYNDPSWIRERSFKGKTNVFCERFGARFPSNSPKLTGERCRFDEPV